MNNAKLTSALEELIVKSRNRCITCLAKKYGFNPEEAIYFLDKKVVSDTSQSLAIVDTINNSHSEIMEQYFRRVKPLIRKKLDAPVKPYKHEPTLLGNDSNEFIKSLEVALKVRQVQMKEGDIAQIIIGSWFGWEDLKKGHPSGMDCRKIDNSIIMEVRNKHNTVKGADIKKSLYPTLSKYKKENPITRCIWAIVNPKPGCKKLREIIIHDGVEIEKIQGDELMKLVFTLDGIDYSKQVIAFVKEVMYPN